MFQNSWFHYAKVYAALAGCWGFIAIKYQWGKIGKAHWFRAWPFVIVAINIMIAAVSDFESAYHFFVLGESTWVPPKVLRSWPAGTTCSTASPASSTSSA